MVVELKGGFRTLWLLFDSNSSTPQQLFYKEHSVRNQEPEYPRGRTLFVLNVPPWATVESLKNAFSKICGSVKSINLANNKQADPKQGFGKIYIVFDREASLDRALDLSQDTILTLYENEDSKSATGLAKWCREYNTIAMESEAATKKKIEAYMHDYDERVAKRLVDEENAAEDEEGWVTVGSTKKRGQFAPSRKESTIDKLQTKEERKNRKKELLNFYTFQIRESKKKNLVELRKKFELDKKRLQQLKSKRTFKPF